MNQSPKSIGTYSQARVAGNLVFVSGQIGIDPESGTLVEGIEEQTKQTLKNVEAVLASQRLSLRSVVKTTVYLKHIEDFPKMNDIYATFFTENKPTSTRGRLSTRGWPARATIGVSDLPKGALIEIEAIASK